MDMGAFVVPKSDQLNSDDLLPGPRTVTITGVSGTGNNDQPVAVRFEGDNGRPYKPCKSMRRVMVEVWGRDATQYVGRSMTLYRDARVAFGGMEVGGIRISHMSHMPAATKMFLTVTKGKKAAVTVAPLVPPGATARSFTWELMEDQLSQFHEREEVAAWLAQAKVQATHRKIVERGEGERWSEIVQRHLARMMPADDMQEEIAE